ncbi:hypothetical protein BDQ17DRAFT_1328825 [Cyathus striatus]|nr:hypothetical protein BDQ17DRAFT_1328825 [Cyathus striatus]
MFLNNGLIIGSTLALNWKLEYKGKEKALRDMKMFDEEGRITLSDTRSSWSSNLLAKYPPSYLFVSFVHQARMKGEICRPPSYKYGAIAAPQTDDMAHTYLEPVGFDQFIAAKVPHPELGPTDIFVNVKAVSVNPVEAMFRAGKWASQLPAGSILEFDCVGVVFSLWSQVPPNAFSTVEEVWRLGSTVLTHLNAEYVAVDYHVVAPKPTSLSFEDATVVPLVGLTAWEMVDQTGVGNKPGALLVINGAGRVGNVVIQLANAKGVKGLSGATHTINLHEPPKPQTEAPNPAELIKYDLVLTNLTKSVLDQSIDIVAPWGRIGFAVQSPPGSYDGLGAGQKKGVSLHWRFVFMRMALKWEMEYQGKALRDMTRLFDEGCEGCSCAHGSWRNDCKVVLKVLEEVCFNGLVIIQNCILQDLSPVLLICATLSICYQVLIRVVGGMFGRWKRSSSS